MSAHELTRKDLKAPDKFQTAAAQAASWASGRKAQLLAALAVVLALLVAMAAYTGWRASKGREAGSLLSRTLAAAAADVSSVPLPGQSARFESDAERQRTVAQRAQALRQEFPSSKAAVTAALAEADARFRLGEWDVALGGYQAFLERAAQDDPLRFAALDGVARVHEAKGQHAEAAQAWQRAGEVKAFADRATIERARVLAGAGQLDEAKKLLAAFPEQYKESPLRSEAADRLAKLGR